MAAHIGSRHDDSKEVEGSRPPDRAAARAARAQTLRSCHDGGSVQGEADWRHGSGPEAEAQRVAAASHRWPDGGRAAYSSARPFFHADPNGRASTRLGQRSAWPLCHRARARARRHGHRLARAGPPLRPPGRTQGAPPGAGGLARRPSGSSARSCSPPGCSIRTSSRSTTRARSRRRRPGPILWFTMPYIEGESLRERLRREGRASAARTRCRITREVARGLHYAHEHGVVHRDVKPENILLTGGRQHAGGGLRDRPADRRAAGGSSPAPASSSARRRT